MFFRNLTTSQIIAKAIVYSVYLMGPAFIIWALNTLFPLAIPLTFKTYIAIVILLIYWRPTLTTNQINYSLFSKNPENSEKVNDNF